jgi:hypothetical protein
MKAIWIVDTDGHQAPPLLVQPMATFAFRPFIVTFYAQYVSIKDANLPLSIVDVIFIAQYVSLKGAN